MLIIDIYLAVSQVKNRIREAEHTGESLCSTGSALRLTQLTVDQGFIQSAVRWGNFIVYEELGLTLRLVSGLLTHWDRRPRLFPDTETPKIHRAWETLCWGRVSRVQQDQRSPLEVLQTHCWTL